MVPDHTLTGGESKEHEGNRPDLPSAERFLGPVAGAGDGLLRFLEAREERCLLQTNPDVEREHDEDRGDPEGVAPTLRCEVLCGHVQSEEQDDRERKEEPDRRGRLDPCRVEAALVIGCVLRDVDRRATVLASQRETLSEPQKHEDDRSDDPDLCICR